MHTGLPFSSISLAELESVSLLRRIDTKFLLPQARLNEFLGPLVCDYRLLTIEERNCFRYRTLYYDTDSFTLYHDHHNGKLGRFKVRAREYVDSGLCFDEVKYKSNKGKTQKYRQRRESFSTCIDESFSSLIRRHVHNENLIPRLTVTYDRMTFTDSNLCERMTIDTNVVFTADGQRELFGPVAIVELKQSRANALSLASLRLKEMKVRATGCSKYCIGVVRIFDCVKKNRFKNKIRLIHKMSEAA